MTDNPHAERFVQSFTAYWSDPSPERMREILTEDVVLKQPLSEPLVGIEASQEEFRKIFAWLPDLRATIHDWGVHKDTLYIEFTLSATLKGKRIEWPVVDRFDLNAQGLATERVSYFNPLPILKQVMQTPTAWLGWMQSGAARPWENSN